MTVIKRSKQASGSDLTKALDELIPLLQDQKEDEAVADLRKALSGLESNEVGSPGFKDAVAIIVDAFEGDHELNAYTLLREGSENRWTEAEILAHASNRVISLARRMQ